jgi:hypothetical protein
MNIHGDYLILRAIVPNLLRFIGMIALPSTVLIYRYLQLKTDATERGMRCIYEKEKKVTGHENKIVNLENLNNAAFTSAFGVINDNTVDTFMTKMQNSTAISAQIYENYDYKSTLYNTLLADKNLLLQAEAANNTAEIARLTEKIKHAKKYYLSPKGIDLLHAFKKQRLLQEDLKRFILNFNLMMEESTLANVEIKINNTNFRYSKYLRKAFKWVDDLCKGYAKPSLEELEKQIDLGKINLYSNTFYQTVSRNVGTQLEELFRAPATEAALRRLIAESEKLNSPLSTKIKPPSKVVSNTEFAENAPEVARSNNDVKAIAVGNNTLFLKTYGASLTAALDAVNSFLFQVFLRFQASGSRVVENINEPRTDGKSVGYSVGFDKFKDFSKTRITQESINIYLDKGLINVLIACWFMREDDLHQKNIGTCNDKYIAKIDHDMASYSEIVKRIRGARGWLQALFQLRSKFDPKDIKTFPEVKGPFFWPAEWQLVTDQLKPPVFFHKVRKYYTKKEAQLFKDLQGNLLVKVDVYFNVLKLALILNSQVWDYVTKLCRKHIDNNNPEQVTFLNALLENNFTWMLSITAELNGDQLFGNIFSEFYYMWRIRLQSEIESIFPTSLVDLILQIYDRYGANISAHHVNANNIDLQTIIPTVIESARAKRNILLDFPRLETVLSNIVGNFKTYDFTKVLFAHERQILIRNHQDLNYVVWKISEKINQLEANDSPARRLGNRFITCCVKAIEDFKLPDKSSIEVC